ncbi:MAG: hypothetical protein QF541_01070 [Lentisphaeria bacterium]|jgi:hypothetical protein|nr:hypothetical protein [Lentisphaeria bacterium]
MSALQGPEGRSINPDALGLTLQFADRFDQEAGAPAGLDTSRWIKWGDKARTENGCGLFEATTAPGEWGDAGVCTREKQFNPGLQGTNGAEVTFVGHAQPGQTPNNKEHPEHIGNPLAGPYVTGMCLTISNYQGPIVPDFEGDPESLDEEPVDADLMSGYRASGKYPSRRRGVQIHFDWMNRWELDYFLCRSILPGDYDKYPEWDVRLDSLKEHIATGQFIGGACFVLAARHYAPDQAVNPLGRRYGLYLTDDGNTVAWTLDGKLMDTIDIRGYFNSSPEFMSDGAYVSVCGAGYQPHTWQIDDVEVYASR